MDRSGKTTTSFLIQNSRYHFYRTKYCATRLTQHDRQALKDAYFSGLEANKQSKASATNDDQDAEDKPGSSSKPKSQRKKVTAKPAPKKKAAQSNPFVSDDSDGSADELPPPEWKSKRVADADDGENEVKNPQKKKRAET